MKFRLITALVFGLVLSLSLLLALTHSPAYAAGITVTTDADSDADDGDCTLREAIEAANTDTAYNGCSAGSGADTITFADDYTITLNGNQLTVITSTIAIIGNGPANTILQANAAPDTATYRVFEVGSAGNLTLDNVTVRHGRCAGACPTQVNNGSGIYNAGTLAVSNSSIISNTSSVNGGGIFNIGILTVTSSLFSHNQGSAIHADWKGQSTVISDTQIVHNRDNSDGGGIDADHPLTVTNSFIGYNIASGGDGGGGLQSGEDVHVLIENSEIVSNTATVEEGGGLYLYRGWATIRNSRIVSNTTYRYGGGIYVDDASTNGMLSIENSEIAYNRVFTDSVGGPADGGGIYINNNPHVKIEDVFIHHNEASRDGGGLWLDDRLVLTMTGSTIAHNAAYNGRGGGIFAETQSLTAENSTISHNQSQHGGGIYAYEGGSEVLITLTHVSLISNTATISGGGLYLDDGSNTGPIVRTTLQNSLITSNAGGDCARLEGWEEIDATPGYNLDSDGTCVTDGVDNNLTSATPGVGPLADNDGYALSDGTVIPTHALLTGSPAIDIIPIGNCVLSEDQRGVSRPQSAGCDIGAYESLAPELTVTKGGDGFGAVTSSPPGIDCGPDCAETYDFGTVVTLTASAETGSNFAGWSGDVVSSANPLAVTMDGSKDITATFTQNQYTLDVTTVGSGSVSKQPDQATYPHGTRRHPHRQRRHRLDLQRLERGRGRQRQPAGRHDGRQQGHHRHLRAEPVHPGRDHGGQRQREQAARPGHLHARHGRHPDRHAPTPAGPSAAGVGTRPAATTHWPSRWTAPRTSPPPSRRRVPRRAVPCREP